MSIGIFVNKEHQPTMEEIFAALGSKRSLWEKLTRFIADNYRTNDDFAFYGKNYGWAMRFAKEARHSYPYIPERRASPSRLFWAKTKQRKLPI